MLYNEKLTQIQGFKKLKSNTNIAILMLDVCFVSARCSKKKLFRISV